MTRRDVFAMVAAAAGLSAVRTVRQPLMRVDNEFESRPTGRQFYSINGRPVSEAEFFASAATHPAPRMRDWAQAWREKQA